MRRGRRGAAQPARKARGGPDDLLLRHSGAPGLVMIADTRTNAGLDNISTFRKLQLFENPASMC